MNDRATRPGAFVYRCLLRLLFPAIAAGTAAVALRDGSLRYLAQRLGHFHAVAAATAQPLWIHCASVGETNAALTFVEAWLKRHPGDEFVLTTNTVTAAKMLASRAPTAASGRVRHCYLPLDYPLFCRRFLDAVKPRCALIIETEIWLNLFCECHGRGIPLLIINARLSQRTLDGARRFKDYYRQSLAAVQAILARSEKDAAAFAALGIAADKITVTGNLKRAGNKTTTLPDLIGRRYVLAASTHADEEVQAAEAWRRALARGQPPSERLLVVAPRHPRRGRAIARQLKKRGFDVRLRSRTQAPPQATPARISVYIADTLGELPALIRHADLVFMGGSLAPVGGHNVLEPAQLGVPQVTGPHTHSFHEEVAALKAVGGLIEAPDQDALEAVFRAALDDAPAHAAAAEKALTLMREYADVVAAYVNQVEAAAAALHPNSAYSKR